MQIKNAYIFYGVASILFAYILYMMVRRRKGERPGSAEGDSEL